MRFAKWRRSTGMLTLGDDALAKVKAGVTTAEELLRVVTEVREMRSVCPGCSGPVALDFVACPACGRRLSGACPGLLPQPAARLDVLPVLRARHRGAQRTAAARAPVAPRTTRIEPRRHQRHRIQEGHAVILLHLTSEI